MAHVAKALDKGLEARVFLLVLRQRVEDEGVVAVDGNHAAGEVLCVDAQLRRDQLQALEVRKLVLVAGVQVDEGAVLELVVVLLALVAGDEGGDLVRVHVLGAHREVDEVALDGDTRRQHGAARVLALGKGVRREDLAKALQLVHAVEQQAGQAVVIGRMRSEGVIHNRQIALDHGAHCRLQRLVAHGLALLATGFEQQVAGVSVQRLAHALRTAVGRVEVELDFALHRLHVVELLGDLDLDAALEQRQQRAAKQRQVVRTHAQALLALGVDLLQELTAAGHLLAAAVEAAIVVGVETVAACDKAQQLAALDLVRAVLERLDRHGELGVVAHDAHRAGLAEYVLALEEHLLALVEVEQGDDLRGAKEDVALGAA